MPSIACRNCGQETFVLANPIGRRHCTNCGLPLPLPVPSRTEVMDRVRQQQIAAAAEKADGNRTSNRDLRDG